jgi:hypothetical protein
MASIVSALPERINAKAAKAPASSGRFWSVFLVLCNPFSVALKISRFFLKLSLGNL